MRKMGKTSLKLAAEAVLQMEQYLRETVWRMNPQKSWENTHIKHHIDRRKAKKPFFINPAQWCILSSALESYGRGWNHS